MKEYPIIIGHRGVAGLELENTLSSFQKAVSLGVGYVETDIWQLADGNHIVFHDHLLSRICKINKKVADLTLAEIKKIQLPNGESIMSLEEYLVWVEKHDIVTLFELKGQGDVKKIYEKIMQYLPHEKFMVQSFFHDQMTYLKTLDSNITTGLLFEGVFENIESYLENNLADFVGLGFESMSGDFVDAIKKTGKKIEFRTIDNEVDIQDCLTFDPRAIISNRPDIVKKVLDTQFIE